MKFAVTQKTYLQIHVRMVVLRDFLRIGVMPMKNGMHIILGICSKANKVFSIKRDAVM